MRIGIVIIFALLSTINLFAQDVWVEGYTRADGTKVKGHFRTKADNNKFNNFTTKGKFNKYTGKKGTHKPKQGVWVKGYTNKNGKFIKGHWRTRPNNSTKDNWSQIGNVNLSTGKKGKTK